MSHPDAPTTYTCGELMTAFIPSPLARSGRVEVQNATYRELISAARLVGERGNTPLALRLTALTKRMKTYGVRHPKYLPYHICEKIAEKGK